MSVSLKGCAAAAALAAFAVAAHGCSSGPDDLMFANADRVEPGTIDEAVETMPPVETGAAEGAAGGRVQVSSAAPAAGQAYPLVQAAEATSGAEVEVLSREGGDGDEDTEEDEALERALEAAAEASRIARELMEAQRAAALDAGVAWAIELAANSDRWDHEAGHYVGGFSYHWEYPLAGSRYASVSRSHRGGGKAGAVLARNGRGELAIRTAIPRERSGNEPLRRDPDVWTLRYIETHERLEGREGVTTDVPAVDDHGLSSGWQRYDLTKEYEGGGTLAVSVFTDVEETDGLPASFGGSAFGMTVLLDDIPEVPADQDFMYVEVPEGGLAGSLDGVSGRFTCAAGSGGYCSLGRDAAGPAAGFYPLVNDAVFRPGDGSEATELRAEVPEEWPHADYLSMGHWLFVPEDAAEFEAYDFGVFSGGSDPFEPAYLKAVAGTAHYTGDAAGMYHARLSPVSVRSGRFVSAVELTADFGTNAELGEIEGRVYGFELDDAAPFTAPLELALGSAKISHSPSSCGGHVPGGWVCGRIPQSTDRDGQWWWGYWSAKFFGNGIVTRDYPPSYASQPTSVAGTFNAKTGSDVGLVGSFGAHLDERTSPDPR